MSAALRLPGRGLQAVLAGAAVGVALIAYGGHRLVGPSKPVPAAALPAQAMLAPAVPPPPPRLALKVPSGLRAFAVQASEEIAVAGLVQPGDRVDVQTVLPATVFASLGRTGAVGEAGTLMQNVLVLAVDDRLDAAAARKSDAPPARTLTLALTPEQASALSLARSLGNFYLALRNPQDAAEAPPARAELADIRHTAAPSAPPRRTRRSPAAVEQHGVELVVGGVSSFIKPEAGAAQ